MKYLKSGSLSNYGAADRGFRINPFGRIDTKSTNSLKVPTGTTSQRPQNSLVTNGVIRYNTTMDVLEGYVSGGWEIIKSAADLTIFKQVIQGSFTDPLYGPLLQIPATPNNILVFVDTTPQFADDNYNLVTYSVDTGSSPSRGGAPYPAGTYIQFTDNDFVPDSLKITVLFGFDL